MGGKSSAPSAPDPFQTAAATTQTNEATAAYNKALNLNNYSNPFGSQQTVQTGVDPNTGAPIYGTNTMVSQQLTGGLQNAFNQIQGNSSLNQNALNGLNSINGSYQNIIGQLGGLGQGLTGINSGLQSLQGQLSPQAAQQAQQQGMNAAYKSSMGYLQPQFNQQQESLNAQLANQGLGVGSQAYNNAQQNLSLNQGAQQQQALNNAELTGSQIGTQNLQNQISGINTQAGLYGQQAQNIGAQAGLFGQQGSNLNSMAGLYGQQVGIGQTPYSNLSSLASLMPGYTGTAQSSSSPADIAGYMNNAYQGQLANYNSNQQSSNAMMGTLGSVAGAAALAFF